MIESQKSYPNAASENHIQTPSGDLMPDNFYEQEQKIIEAFNIMWSKYPEPAMLIHRGKRVLALNWSCRNVGLKLGSFCHEISGCRDTTGDCLINSCLDSRQAVHTKVNDGRKQWSIHWVPIENNPDYCVHFFAGSVDEH